MFSTYWLIGGKIPTGKKKVRIRADMLIINEIEDVTIMKQER